MNYGLIGKSLTHSYSKIIQEQLLDRYTYDLHPLAQEDLDAFMKKKDFKAINVTIPYKQQVIKYLDQVDPHAKKINAVNTIVKKEEKLIGYNTDYDGFLYMLNKHHIKVMNKKVLILGDGGASQAVQAVIQDLHPKEMIVANRTQHKNTISYQEAIENHADAQIIINTTSVGMYPKVEQEILDVLDFPRCEAVFDCIYNPLETKFTQRAKQLKVPVAVTGLEMLVAQAKYALEHFKDIRIEDGQIDLLYRKTLKQTSNLILCTKDDELCKQVAEKLHKSYKKLQTKKDAYSSGLVLQVSKLDPDYMLNGFYVSETNIPAILQKYEEAILAFNR